SGSIRRRCRMPFAVRAARDARLIPIGLLPSDADHPYHLTELSRPSETLSSAALRTCHDKSIAHYRPPPGGPFGFVQHAVTSMLAPPVSSRQMSGALPAERDAC